MPKQENTHIQNDMLFRFLNNLDLAEQKALTTQLIHYWTCTSTGLEGNTFSLGDTSLFLETGKTIAGKTIKEHDEIKRHANAIMSLAHLQNEPAITEEHLFTLHEILSVPSYDYYAPIGAWKREDNGTFAIDKNGQEYYKEYPSHTQTPKLMKQWLELFNQHYQTPIKDSRSGIEVFARLHNIFVSIHPFADGNGRMSRILANLPLLKNGLCPIIVPKDLRREYCILLEEYQKDIKCIDNLDSLCNVDYTSSTTFFTKTYFNTIQTLANNQLSQNELEQLHIITHISENDSQTLEPK